MLQFSGAAKCVIQSSQQPEAPRAAPPALALIACPHSDIELLMVMVTGMIIECVIATASLQFDSIGNDAIGNIFSALNRKIGKWRKGVLIAFGFTDLIRIWRQYKTQEHIVFVLLLVLSTE